MPSTSFAIEVLESLVKRIDAIREECEGLEDLDDEVGFLEDACRSIEDRIERLYDAT